MQIQPSNLENSLPQAEGNQSEEREPAECPSVFLARTLFATGTSLRLATVSARSRNPNTEQKELGETGFYHDKWLRRTSKIPPVKSVWTSRHTPFGGQ